MIRHAPSLRILALAALLTLSATACETTVDVRGHLPPPEDLAQIKPGKTNQDEVQTLLGTPSSVMTYGEETWYYISTTTERWAFERPEIKEQTVVAITFDKRGLVKDMEVKGLQDGKTVTIVERTTPTAGKDLNVLEQLLGNVGRFSKEAK